MIKKPIILFDIDYTLFDTALFKQSGFSKHKIYEEVMRVLDDLSVFATLGIFSEGQVDFQKNKLKETKIGKYFMQDNAHIVSRKVDALKVTLGKYKDRKIFFVDDKLSILYNSKELFPEIFTIWVKRGPFASNQKAIPGFAPDSEVENLSEIVKIVKSEIRNF